MLVYTCIPAHVSKIIEVPLTVSYCHGNENSSFIYMCVHALFVGEGETGHQLV